MRMIKYLWPAKNRKFTKKIINPQYFKFRVPVEYWGLFIISFLLVLPVRTEASVNIDCENFSLATDNFDQETDQFLKAKELVFEGDWHQARIQLEKYLVNYADGSYRDEAYYWLARSLNKLAGEEVIVEKVIALKEEAAARLDILIDKYPQSLWLDDGVTLRLSLAAELDFMGRGGLYKQIQKLMKKKDLEIPSTKESDLTYFLEMRPEVAVALVRKMFEFQTDAKYRKELVALFGRHFGDEGQKFLQEIANSDDSPEVKKEANYWINRNKMRKIPTQLIYFGCSAKITDKKEMSEIPENKINFYPIPRLNSENKENVENTINRFFHLKLNNVKFVTRMIVDLSIYGMETSNNIQGFNFKIFQEDLQKDWDKISGKLRFRDNETKHELKERFIATEKNDQLVAMRKRNRLALILLHFVPASEEQRQTENFPVKLIYHTEFSNVLGCKVLSTRGAFSMKEISEEGSVSDFGQAKVEIPTKKGKWILAGNIIVDRQSQRFVARSAELFDENGKLLTKGVQIIVPVKKPDQYEVVGKKKGL